VTEVAGVEHQMEVGNVSRTGISSSADVVVMIVVGGGSGGCWAGGTRLPWLNIPSRDEGLVNKYYGLSLKNLMIIIFVFDLIS